MEEQKYSERDIEPIEIHLKVENKLIEFSSL